MPTERCQAMHAVLMPSTHGTVAQRLRTQCVREADHPKTDALRRWPEGSGMPRTPTRKKGGFMLTKFPIVVPIHRDEVGGEWTDEGAVRAT